MPFCVVPEKFYYANVHNVTLVTMLHFFLSMWNKQWYTLEAEQTSLCKLTDFEVNFNVKSIDTHYVTNMVSYKIRLKLGFRECYDTSMVCETFLVVSMSL